VGDPGKAAQEQHLSKNVSGWWGATLAQNEVHGLTLTLNLTLTLTLTLNLNLTLTLALTLTLTLIPTRIGGTRLDGALTTPASL